MRILIVGYGSIGKRHYEVLKSLRPDADITVVTKQNLTQPPTYINLKDIPDLDTYGYFLICSETYLHREQLKFIDGCVDGKCIFVEKPVFDSFSDYTSGRNRIYVGYNLRFHPVLQQLKTILSSQKILSVNIVAGQFLPAWRPQVDYTKAYSARKSEGGGVLLDLSHEIDYTQWLFGIIVEAKSMNTKISALEIDSDDIMNLIGMTDRNIYVNISLDYLSKKPIRNIIVHCEAFSLYADLIAGKLEKIQQVQEKDNVCFFKIERNDTYFTMHRSIMENNGLDVCTLQEALGVMKTIDVIQKNRR